MLTTLLLVAATAALDVDCNNKCVVGAYGYDGLARRIMASDKSCRSYAMRAVDPEVHRTCGGGTLADLVATCASGVDPQCYTHQSAAIAYIVMSNAVGAISWIGLTMIAVKEVRRRRASAE